MSALVVLIDARTARPKPPSVSETWQAKICDPRNRHYNASRRCVTGGAFITARNVSGVSLWRVGKPRPWGRGTVKNTGLFKMAMLLQLAGKSEGARWPNAPCLQVHHRQ